MHKPILTIGERGTGKSRFVKQLVQNTKHIYATQADIDCGSIHSLIKYDTEYVIFDGISIDDSNKSLEEILFLPPWFYKYVDIVFIVITNETAQNMDELKESFQVIQCPYTY